MQFVMPLSFHRSPLGRHSSLACFCAMALVSSLAGESRATIDAGSTTVPSIGHFFVAPFDGRPGVVVDFLVNQTQEVGGGAVLPNVSADLDADTSISYTLQAPAGQHFLVDLPAGAMNATIESDITWTTGSSDIGSSLGFHMSFQNLTGTPPAIPNNSAVGDGNQFFDFTTEAQGLSSDLSFSSLTMTTSYASRNLGLGTLEYSPTGFSQFLGTSREDAGFIIAYQTEDTVDPGRFVSIVPEPSTAGMLTLGMAGLAAYRRRRSDALAS